MIAAHITDTGALIAIYERGVGVSPPGAVEYGLLLEITAEQRDVWITDASQRWVDGELMPWQPALTAEQLVEQIRAAVQAHVDTIARERLYDNGNSLASYVASTNPKWAAEAQAFVAWRDAVWAQVYSLWAAPPDPWPTPEAVIADLPAIIWPA